jgi:hypothetical protein
VPGSIAGRPERPGGQSENHRRHWLRLRLFDSRRYPLRLGRQDPGCDGGRLCGVAGLKGQAAQNRLALVRNKVDVPWGAALDVFSDVSIPKYLRSCAVLPRFDELTPDCKGVLLPLIYNHGADAMRSIFAKNFTG